MTMNDNVKKIKLFLFKMKNSPESIKAAVWFTICSLINKGIQVLTIPIFTRLLTTEEYGEYSVFISWQNILTILITLNLYSNVFNNGLIKYHIYRLEFLASLQGLVTIIGILIILPVIFFPQWIHMMIGLPSWIIGIMIIEILTMSGFELWAANQRFDFKYKKIVFTTLLVAIFNPVVGIVWVSLSSEKGQAWILAVLVVQIGIYLLFYINNFVKGRLFFCWKYWKYALTLAIPLIPHYLSQMLLNQMDRIMISRLIGNDKAGIYSVAYSVAMVMQMVGKAIQNAYTPWVYKNILKSKNDIAPVVNILIIIIGILNFLLICLAPEVISFFGGSTYLEAIYVIPPIISSCYLIFIYSIFCVIEFYFEETKMMMIVSVVGALINFITNAVFIPVYGYYAAGYTTLFSYCYFVIAHFYVMNHVIKRSGIISTPVYDTKFILIFSIFFIIISIGMTFTYQMPILRYMILILILFGIYYKRDFFYKLVGRIQ